MRALWRILRKNYWPLILSILLLSALGILFTYSASYRDPASYEMKQVLWVCAGFVAFFIISLIGYRTFLSLSYLLYVIALLLLVWVLIAGQVRFGAQRWISLGPLVVQPSEFAKFAVILALSQFLGANYSWERENRVIIGAVAIVLIPLLLIMKQPDLGTSLLFIPMLVAMLFVWGIRFRYIIISAVLAVVSAPVFWLMLKEYQKKRILTFLNPQLDPLGSGYTAIQSKIAIGRTFGKGYREHRVS